MKNSGVLLLLFDLPSVTLPQKREYRKFMKYIKSVGFICLQESVYVKLQRTTEATQYDIEDIKRNNPKEGSVMILPLTVAGFSKLTSLSGEKFDVHFFCDDFIVVG